MAKKKSSKTTSAGLTEQQMINYMNNLTASTNQTIRDMSNANTARTFEFNASEAQKSRDWQTEMSNSSHQREVEDLKRAGLNPVLSANGGAQAYSTSSASGSADSSAVGALASIYQNQMNNLNSIRLAKMNNAKDLEIAKINAAASLYASDNSASASRYATDHSKYGMIDSFVKGVLGEGSSSNTSASKLGSGVKSVAKILLSNSPGNPKVKKSTKR